MKKFIALLLAILLLTGCQGPRDASAQAEKVGKTVYAMDTVMSLTAYGENAAAGLSRAETEILRLEDLLSISRESSDIYRLNRDGEATLSGETARLIEYARRMWTLTGGDFNPMVYPLMKLWGFSTGSYRVPADAEIRALLPLPEPLGPAGDLMMLSDGSGLDLGGIAKGYTSDRALFELEDAGVSSAIISLGGNVGTLGLKPDGSQWTVAIRDPKNEESYIATLSLGEGDGKVYAITSGGYERFFEQDGKTYHHILDPKTGAPAETDLLSVTVVTRDGMYNNGMYADALSTALFVKGFEAAVAFWRDHSPDFGMVLVTEDGVFSTEGLSISAETAVTTLEVTP